VRTRLDWAVLALGFSVTTTWTIQSGRSVDASWIGCVVAVIAAGQLARPDSATAAAIGAGGAGVAAATWAAVLQLEAIPPAPALVVAGGTLLASAWLTTHRPAFAPTTLREEALLILLIAGVVVGMAPTVAQGWQSAVALNMTVDTGAPGQLVPVWTLSFVGAAVALGALWSIWKRG
jgi:hypothetical protein